MKYVKDKQLLEKLNIYKKSNMYAVYINDIDEQDIDDTYLSSVDIDDNFDYNDIDNSDCNGDYDKVSANYHGIKDYMKGCIKVFKKGSKFSELQGIYDITGNYLMQSSRSTIGYLGDEGRARCIAIPQCKFMNSTTILDNVKHDVYIACQNPDIEQNYWGDIKQNYHFNKSINFISNKSIKSSYNEWSSLFTDYGKRVPFDVWTIIGCIYGKALKIFRGVINKDFNKLPSYMTITISQIYQTLMPNSKWSALSDISKYEFKKNIVKIFFYMKTYGLLFDLPDEQQKRSTYFMKSLMWNTWIKRRAMSDKEKDRCMKEWNEPFEPWGFKVRLRGSYLFDFCFNKKTHSTRLVQIRPYDYDVKEILNSKGLNKVFQTIFASWFINYRNFWVKKDKIYDESDLVWKQKQMLLSFKNSIFKIDSLSTKDMEKIMEWYSIKKVFDTNSKRPAHIDKYFINKRCQISWTLPISLRGNDIIVKNEQGHNISLQEANINNISDEVKLAKSRMSMINEENKLHKVVFNNKVIDTFESVIYNVKKINGIYEIDDKHNGRCYSNKYGIQSLHGYERKEVLIDGNRVKEIDYSSMHPTMLYNMNGIDAKNIDMYNIGNAWYSNDSDMTKELARKAVKMMLLRMINARNVSNAIHSFKTAWNKEIMKRNKKTYIPWLFNLFEEIKKYHSKIAHEFCTGKGTRLMNLDGKLIREVEYRLTRDKICTLGIHDSIIVDIRYYDKAKRVMKEEYEKMFNGFEIKVK